MANKKALTIPVSRDRLIEALKYRKSSIRKLGDVPEIERTEKTIRRCLNQDAIPPDILDRIGKYLDVHPNFLSGKYDKSIEFMKKHQIKSQLKVENFPYFVKEQDSLDYMEYFRSILLMHHISMNQYLALELEQRKRLHLDVERAITAIIYKNFDCDAIGKDDIPELQRMEVMIDCTEVIDCLEKDVFCLLNNEISPEH